MGSHSVLGLGLDAGGSQTRWALVDAQGHLLAQGAVAGMSGLQLKSQLGLQTLRETIRSLAAALAEYLGSDTLAVYGGITGLGDVADQNALRSLLQEHLSLYADRITLTHDMDIAYRAAFAPGEGYLVYAGTGSIAAYMDAQGHMHRAGGRGGVLGDEGGGYWIAREALAWIWRKEDRIPGAWKSSPMARRLLDAVGGGDRGSMGRLALQVAASAHDDPFAHDLLLRSGAALAELASHMLHRFGPRPVTAGGRAWLLSPLLEEGLRAGLADGVGLNVVPDLMAHVTAARQALIEN
jgi:N-acetylglucosamine kinase-like BadF-type ATPase